MPLKKFFFLAAFGSCLCRASALYNEAPSRRASVTLLLDIQAANTSSLQVTLPLHSPGTLSSTTINDGPTSTAVTSPIKSCIVTPHGWGIDDSPAILAAVDRCGTDG